MTFEYLRAFRFLQFLLGVATSTAFAGAGTPPAEILIEGDRVFPESLTSTSDGTVIIGSLGARAIFRAERGSSSAKPWILAGLDGLQRIFGVFADERANTLWACSSTLPEKNGIPPLPAALYAFSLKTGAPVAHYVFPTVGSLCNDIAVARNGTVYATDSTNMEVVRLKKGARALEVWAGNGVFGPKDGVVDGIAVLGNRVLVNALAESKLYSVPIERSGNAGPVIEVALNRTIDRPDGMRRFGRNSVLVVEGGHGGRLSLVTLKGDTGVATTLKEGFPEGPVAVATVGSTAYVLEGQLSVLFHNPDPNAELKPFHAVAVDISNLPND